MLIFSSLTLLCCLEALGILMCPSEKKSIRTAIIIPFIIVFFIERNIDNISVNAKYITTANLIIDLLLIISLMRDFYFRYAESRKVKSIASKVHLTSSRFRIIAALLLGGLAIHAVDYLLCVYRYYAEMGLDAPFPIKALSSVIPVIFVSLIQCMLLDYSTMQKISGFIGRHTFSMMSNAAFFLAANAALFLLINNWKVVLTATTIVIFIYSVANYYVTKYHGSPLFFSEFANFKTALDVAGSYSYEFSIPIAVIVISVTVLISMFITILPSQSNMFLYRGETTYGMLSVLLISLLVGVIGYRIIDPHKRVASESVFRVKTDGFLFTSICDLCARINPIVVPSGYDEKLIVGIKPDEAVGKKYPDIILILNETFCDLKYTLNIETDVDYLEAFRNIEGAIYGNALSANIGGGTNDSEFELLTSKSRYLLKTSAPFTYLKDEILSRSLVQYLKEGFGYETTAMHVASKNYSRDTAYPKMGFDNIYLGSDKFEYKGKNGNRPWLDIDNFHDLIDRYKRSGNPQFMYLLTYQNHGGYRQNEAATDTVHVKKGCISDTDEINEYLSSIRLSAEAFRELTEYFRKIDRDVVICMVGDHAPSFINSLPYNTEQEIANSNIAKCVVPYAIWSNFDMDTSFYAEYATMTDLVPMILKAAGIPLSSFYKTVLELHEQVPIRTKEGRYLDRAFKEGMYGEDSDYKTILDRYIFMEYNSLLPNDKYNEELFMI